ncbi:MAG: ATP-dependent helicase, partial [Propionibacteriales bacterium]|nr:ATP-dependent helicase [Propionibacteriales bacterium]
MSIPSMIEQPSDRVINSVEDLCRLLEIPFSDQQLEAITAPLEPGVIIAGAGSGKTTVMAARVVWLVGTGVVRPEEVLGLTFTRKAAAELSARVRHALTMAGVVSTDGVDESGEQLIMTYDAFAARLVTDHGLRIGVDADPTMITGATRHRLASRVVASAAGPFENISRLRPATVTERVLQLDQEMQQHLVGTVELERHAWRFGQDLERAPRSTRGQVYKDLRTVREKLDERLELASLAVDYAAVKRRLGVVEFADQMSVAAELARRVPEVSTQLRATYRVVLLDEYQDTSSAQALMLQGLFSGADVESGRGHPVTAVGDPFQAIYGWRGAAASNITGFGGDFPKLDDAPAREFALTVNRRSGQTVLDVANVLAEPLRGADEVGVDRRLVAGEGAGSAEVHAATFSTWPEEVAWICDRIVNLGPPVDTPRARRGRRTAPEGEAAAIQRWSDLAVLTRRNADVAEIYAELTARDVPAEIVGLGGLLHLPEVSDVIATLRVIDDVTANPELIRLLSGPRWAIGARDLALLGKRARDLARTGPAGQALAGATVLDDLAVAVAEADPTEVVSLLDALESPGDLPYGVDARQRFTRLAGEFTTLRHHADEPVLDLTRRVITMLGLDVELAATPEFARSDRRDQLATFVDAVGDYVDVDGDASLGGLLSWLQAEIDSGVGLERAVPTDQDSVKLLTVHKAKGLEWTAVFLPALVEGTFPSDRVTSNWLTNAAVVPSPLRGDRTAIPQVAEPFSIQSYRSFAD